MKKIFTLLTAILLSASMAMQAQESPIRDADVSATSSQIIADETELLDDGIYVGDVTGPRKAPAATPYAMMKNSTVQYAEIMKLSTTNCYKIIIKVANNYGGAVKTGFVVTSFNTGSNTKIGGNHQFSSTYSNCTESDNWFVQNYSSSSNALYVDNPYGYIQFTYQSMGADGYPIYRIYIHDCYGYTYNNGCINWKSSGAIFSWDNNVSVHPMDANKDRIDFTDYYTISVSSNNNSYGTVSGGGTYAAGAARTLTASVASSSYQFLGWKKNGGSSYVSTSASYNVTVNGNDSYVAEFAPKAAPQYTITTAVSPSNTYGTVTGAGSYYENNPATLTATSANEHLYIFDHWLKDGNNYAGGTTITPTVTAAATYTAVFRAAAAGTITGVAAHGTISGTGNYAGGTAVQLGVTADDGYIFTQWSDGNQDNPRTVYVDGNKNYTAQFVQGVGIHVEMGRLGVYDSNDAATMNDGSSGNAWFHIIGRDGEYEVRFESYGKYFSPGVIYGPSHVDESNSWVKKNGVKVPLNFSDISATATLNRTYGGKYGIYDISMRFVGTDGKIYMVSGQCVRAIYFDTADDYAFPKMDYNFGAPSYRDMIPEDYGPNLYTYTADGDGKWLYLKQSISGVDYYLRLCFKVAGNSIPTGTYQLNATGSGIPVGTAIPTILYNIATTGNNWPNEVNGSCVFVWEQTGDENAYWWFLQYGTINVVNTNGVYYVEVDAINSFAEPVRFTMGTPPAASYTLGWDANGGNITVAGTAAGSVTEGASITAPTVTRTGYTFNGWSPTFTGTMPAANTTYVAQWTPQTYDITYKDKDNADYSGSNLASLPATHTYNTPTNLVAGVKDGYTFGGWYTDAECTVSAGSTIGATDKSAAFTLYAKWIVNNHTVTIAKNENSWGTVSRESVASVPHGTNITNSSNTVTINGTTVTATPADATAQYTYAFDSWTNGTATVNDDMTVTANFTRTVNTYTVTWKNGETVLETDENVSYGATPTYNGDEPTKAADAQYTYAFTGWTPEVVAVTDDAVYSATFSSTPKSYTLTWISDGDELTGDYTTGTVAYGTTIVAPATPTKTGYTFANWSPAFTGTMPAANTEYVAQWNANTYTVSFNKNNESATGSMDAQAFTYGTAQNLTANGFTLSGYDFAGWALTENGEIVYTNQAEVNNLTSEHEGTVTLYAKWIEVFALIDSYNAGNNYYKTLADKAGQTMNVRYERTFTKDRWCVFSVPFNYSFRPKENTTFNGLVYYLLNAEYTTDGVLTLNFMPNSTGIKANVPYIVIPKETIVNPVFNNVTLKGIDDGTQTVPNTEGTLKFINTQYRQTINRADADENKRVVYLSANHLYYPNTSGDTWMRAFSGYFYMQNCSIYHTPYRLRFLTSEGDMIEQAMDNEAEMVETRKYIENGILVIERAGIKYDAQGHIIK